MKQNSEQKVEDMHLSPDCRQIGVSGSVVDLIWDVWEGQFGNNWISIIEGWSTNYCIWIDRESGKTKVSGLDRKHTNHPSVQDAKVWCQKDFTEKVLKLVSTDR